MSSSSSSYSSSLSDTNNGFVSARSSLSTDDEECVFTEDTDAGGIQPYAGEPVVSYYHNQRLIIL